MDARWFVPRALPGRAPLAHQVDPHNRDPRYRWARCGQLRSRVWTPTTDSEVPRCPACARMLTPTPA